MVKRNFHVVKEAKGEISLSQKVIKPKKGKGYKYNRAKEKRKWSY